MLKIIKPMSKSIPYGLITVNKDNFKYFLQYSVSWVSENTNLPQYGSTFSIENCSSWVGGSNLAWLECRLVTPEAAGSNPVFPVEF